MSRKTAPLLFGALVLCLFAIPAAAQALTIGSTAQPSGSTASLCPPGAVVAQLQSDPAGAYDVPAGGGRIESWSINTAGAAPGAAITFLALRIDGGNATVVGSDSETLPNPLPPSGVASFDIASPIPVLAGDTLGLYQQGDAMCYFHDGNVPMGDVLAAYQALSPPSVGQTLPYSMSSMGQYELNLSADVETGVDAGVIAAASTGTSAGNLAQLSALVTNGGPLSGPIAFTDTVPSGLAIRSAVAGLGSCNVTGQTVTCTITGLPPGQSAPVAITVVPAAAGTYANAVAVSTGPLTDPNAANNTAATSLVVGAAPPVAGKVCIVPPLGRTSLSVAKRILRALDCGVGKVRHAHSRKVHRGDVISASPSKGIHPAGTKVKLKVSSGPPHKKHKKHGHTKKHHKKKAHHSKRR